MNCRQHDPAAGYPKLLSRVLGWTKLQGAPVREAICYFVLTDTGGHYHSNKHRNQSLQNIPTKILILRQLSQMIIHVASIDR
jgi:hypothetical protein